MMVILFCTSKCSYKAGRFYGRQSVYQIILCPLQCVCSCLLQCFCSCLLQLLCSWICFLCFYDKRLKTGLVLVNACRFLLSPIEGQRYRLTLCGLNTFNAAFVMSCLPVCNNTRTLDKLSLRYILEDSVRHGHTFRCWLKHGNNDWPIYIYACIRVWLAKCLSVRKVVRRENADGTQTHFLNRTHIFWTKLENNLRTELEHIFLTELKTHFLNRT